MLGHGAFSELPLSDTGAEIPGLGAGLGAGLPGLTLLLGTLLNAAGGPVTHAATGALTGQGATVAGSATRFRAHPSSGVLTGPGATVAGSATRYRTHTTTGVLAGPGAVVSGAARRFRTHPSSGTLTGQGAAVSGAATRFRAHPATGALTGQGSTVSGAATRFRAHPATGALVGPGAVVAGDAARTGSFITHDASGSLVGQGAVVSGAANHVSAPTSKGAGGVARKRQKRVWARIGDKVVLGTQKDLEAYYEAVIAATVGEPVTEVPKLTTRPATKAKPKVAPEVVKAPDLEYPGADWAAMWRDLVARQELASADALANVIRARIIRDRMLEEDDEEVLLLL